MGHDATISLLAYKIDTLNVVTAQFSVAVQQDEFVTWGSVSVMPN
jgi:hypothetical protein